MVRVGLGLGFVLGLGLARVGLGFVLDGLELRFVLGMDKGLVLGFVLGLGSEFELDISNYRFHPYYNFMVFLGLTYNFQLIHSSIKQILCTKCFLNLCWFLITAHLSQEYGFSFAERKWADSATAGYLLHEGCHLTSETSRQAHVCH